MSEDKPTKRLCKRCNKTDISHRHPLTKFCPKCQADKNYELVMKRQKGARE